MIEPPPSALASAVLGVPTDWTPPIKPFGVLQIAVPNATELDDSLEEKILKYLRQRGPGISRWLASLPMRLPRVRCTLGPRLSGLLLGPGRFFCFCIVFASTETTGTAV